MDFLRGQYIYIHLYMLCGPVRIILTEDEVRGQYIYIYMGHYQNTRTFSCSYFGDIKYFRSRFALAYYFSYITMTYLHNMQSGKTTMKKKNSRYVALPHTFQPVMLPT